MAAIQEQSPAVTTAGGTGCHVYVLATKASAGSQNMLGTLRHFGYSVTVLGEGQNFGGWRWRMQMYRDAAAAHGSSGSASGSDTVKADDILIFVDAYDALAVRPAPDFRQAFEAFGADIVVGAESGCALLNCGRVQPWWDAHIAAAQRGDVAHTSTTLSGSLPRARYANGGFMAGKPQAVAFAYQWMLDNKYWDDQTGVAGYLRQPAHLARVALDYDARLVENVHKGEALMGNAFFLHFPGSRSCINATPYNAIARSLLGESAATVHPYLAARDKLLIACIAGGSAATLAILVLLILWVRRRMRGGGTQ